MQRTTQESRGTVEGSGVSFLDWLVESRALTAILAERVARVQSETADTLAAILLKLGLISETDLANGMARFCRLPRLEPSAVPPSAPEIGLLNEVPAHA